MTEWIDSLLVKPWMHTVLGVLILLLVAGLAGLLVRRILLRTIKAISERTTWRWDDALTRRGVFKRVAQMVPTLIVQFGIRGVPGLSETVDRLIGNVALTLTVLFGLLALSAALTALEDLYQESPQGRERSIKGFVQLGKIIMWVIGAIVMIACLVDRSALSLLAGLGAISAVLLLIFKDTILSVVASVQLSSNDMLRVGDWISMPDDGTDGFVVDVALHTVKVQNWDKTVSTVPTWHLISKSFRNWRGMYDSGGRRMRRALNVDVTSVHFMDSDEIDHLSKFRLLGDYFERKHKEVSPWNEALGDPGKLPINRRRLSNLGSFRAYMQAYIDAHPDINHDMLCAVRQLDPGPMGIPMQIYCYTSVTDFVPHENVQSDIFDHLIAIAPEFGLKLFQQPAGTDLRSLLSAEANPNTNAVSEAPPSSLRKISADSTA